MSAGDAAVQARPAPDPLDTWAARIGYSFRNPDLLRRALTHVSRARQEGAAGVGSYERLEFLGDAVLAAILAEALHGLLPQAGEGELSRRFMDLARGRMQVHVARELGMAEVVRFGDDLTDGARSSERILEDVFEALIGAIFLDGGFEAARERALHWYGDLLARAQVQGQDNAKGKLQEILQARNPIPKIRYTIVAAEGPDNDRTYTAEVRIDGVPHGVGVGRRKKDAEQAAARAALDALGEE